MAAAEPVALRHASSQLRKAWTLRPTTRYEMRRSEEEAQRYSYNHQMPTPPFFPFNPFRHSTHSRRWPRSPPRYLPHLSTHRIHRPRHIQMIISTAPSLSQTSSAASYYQSDHRCRNTQRHRGNLLVLPSLPPL